MRPGWWDRVPWRRRRLLRVGAALALLAGAGLLELRGEDSSTVIVVSRDLPGGHRLGDDDLTVRTLPAQNLARLQFAAPDALADNVVVADRNEIRQYVFLTNQITVTPAKKAAANAGFGELDFTQFSNAAALLKDYNVKLVGTTGTAGKRLYQLEATPRNASTTDRARVWITEAGWRPTRMQLVSAAGKTLADLSLSNYKVNSGLSASALRALPKDAQIIKQ